MKGKSVFRKSEGKLSRSVIGIYRAARVNYSAVCTAGDCFLVDIQLVFGKTDHYFQQCTVRIE
jgi:hypothetical protein